jgi:hypothetical protein
MTDLQGFPQRIQNPPPLEGKAREIWNQSHSAQGGDLDTLMDSSGLSGADKQKLRQNQAHELVTQLLEQLKNEKNPARADKIQQKLDLLKNGQLPMLSGGTIDVDSGAVSAGSGGLSRYKPDAMPVLPGS